MSIWVQPGISSPRAIIALAGWLGLLLMLTIASVEVIRGEAQISHGRGRPVEYVTRKDQPARFWGEIRAICGIGLAMGGGLIGLSMVWPWLERTPKAEDRKAGRPDG